MNNLLEKRNALLEELQKYSVLDDFLCNYHGTDSFIEDDLSDLINEFADNKVPIYYFDIDKFCENFDGEEYVQRCIDEGLINSKNFDLTNGKRMAIYTYESEKIYEFYDELEELQKFEIEIKNN